jgi:hypothetical protein
MDLLFPGMDLAAEKQIKQKNQSYFILSIVYFALQLAKNT